MEVRRYRRIPVGGILADVSETATYSVPGMHCARCERAVKEEVSAVPGVSDVAVDLETKVVTVIGEPLHHEAVRAAIAEAGYEAA
jgi:copper chaperone